MNKNLKKLIEEIIVEEAESTSEIKKVQIMALNKWDDFPSAADISLAGSQGVGPGEHRLAKIFGGEVQGQSQSFDLLVPSGADFAGQWEVKAPDGAGTIRPGTEGLRAYAPLNKALKTALDELQEFLETDNIEASVDADTLDQIRTFTEDHGDKIVRGEVTKNRFDEVQRIFELVGEMIKSMSGDAVKKVSIGDKQYDVTPTTLVKISRLLGTSEEDMRAELGDSMGSAVILSALNSPAFLNIQDLVDLWEGSIQPEEVFDLDGIILVNRQGFMLIPKGQYQGNVSFNRVTQSKPRFKVPMKGEGKMDESLVREFIREALLIEALTKTDERAIETMARKQIDKKWKEHEKKIDKMFDERDKTLFRNDAFYKVIARIYQELQRAYAEDQFKYAARYTRKDIPLARFRPS